MLSVQVEKKTTDRLISKEEVPTTLFSTSPFDNRDDVVLLGRIASISKGGLDFKSKRTFSFGDKSEKPAVGLRDNSVEYAQKDLQKSPNNPYLMNNLGLAYLANKELEKAFEMFTKATVDNKDFVVARLNLATVHRMRKEDDLALTIYKDLLKVNANDTRALINIGIILFESGKVKEAKGIFKKITEIESTNIAARNRLAIVELVSGDIRNAIKDLRECLRLDGNLHALHNNLGVGYAALTLHKKAISSFKLALRLSPSYSNAAANLAKVLRQKGEVQSAINVLEEFLGDYQNVEISELLAGLYVENREFQKSIKVLTNLILNASKFNLPNQEVARLMNNAGVVYHQKGDLQSAERFYLACLEKAGLVNYIPITNIIDLYFRLNRLDNAKSYIELFHAQFPNENLYSFYQGVYEYRVEHISKAITLLEDFITINRDFAPGYALLSYLYSDHTCEYSRAIDLLKRGLEKFPNDMIIINNLAYAYLMNDEIENAKAVLEKVKDSGDYIFLTATRGLLEIKNGDITKGRELYNRAAELAADKALRVQVLQKKELELARYYFAHNNKEQARTHLEKIIFDKQSFGVYRDHALKLYDLIK